VSSDHAVSRDIIVPTESVEEVVSAVLAVTPLDLDAPIVVEGEGELSDTAFAVTGLAADAEGHRVDALPVSSLALGALLLESRVTITVAASSSFGFLLLKGSC